MKARRRRTAGVVFSVAIATGGLLVAQTSQAQLVRRPPPRRPPTAVTATADAANAPRDPNRTGDLRSRFGVPVAERLLRPAGGDPAPRRRALVRLASIGTPQALELLLRTWETDVALARDGRTRLELTRALSPLARERGVRELLQRMVMLGGDPADDLTALAASAAALSLSASGDPEAFDFLVALARQDEAGGEVTADLARRALAAHPPTALPAALAPRTVATPALVRLALELGDLRAIPFLRGAVRGGDADVRLAALVALGKLGDGEAVPIARLWVNETEQGPRLAALRVLADRAPDECAVPLAKALADQALRDEALALAPLMADARLLPALRKLAADKDESVRVRAIVSMGKMVDEEAPRALEPLLGDPTVALSVVAALASSPAPNVGTILARALKSPPRRVAAVHASLARKLSRREDVAGLDAAVNALAAGDPHERAAAAFARASLGGKAPAVANDSSLLSAAVRGLFASGDKGRFDDLLSLLDHDDVDEVVAAALVEPEIAARVPSARLLRWVESGGAHAPLAARTLAARDEEAFRVHLERFQRSPDLAVRSHVALGLGMSARPDAAARLATAYASETRPVVRRALIVALGGHRGLPTADRTLALARRLDGDDKVRALAAVAIAGTRPGDGRGPLTAFVRVDPTLEGAPLRFELPSGLVIPVRAAPGGILAFPALASGEAHVSLAVRSPRREEATP